MADDDTIYPTHSCFDDTVANLVLLVQEKGSRLTDGSLLICHGIIAGDGELLAHAWIELDGQFVVDSGLFKGERITFLAELPEFYAKVQAQDVTKYMPVDAAHLEMKTKSYGPWEDRYRKLCGRAGALKSLLVK